MLASEYKYLSDFQAHLHIVAVGVIGVCRLSMNILCSEQFLANENWGSVQRNTSFIIHQTYEYLLMFFEQI